MRSEEHTDNSLPPPLVAIVSPFFPHYRNALFSELERTSHYQFEFLGSSSEPVGSGIPGFDPGAVGRFTQTVSRSYIGGLLWQHGVIRHALTTRARVVVYTGDAKHLSTWLAASIARVRGVSVAFWTHGWKAPDTGLKRFVRRHFYKIASSLFLYGNRAKRIALGEGFTSDRISVLYNSLGAPLTSPSARQSPQRDGPQANRPRQRWIAISRLTHARRLHLLLRMVHHLALNGMEVELTIVGDGPARAELESLAEELRLVVSFRGAIYEQHATAELLSNSDVCVSPGDVGLTVIHALSSGCPVATHDGDSTQGPEVEAIRHGVTGMRIPMDDPEASGVRVWNFVASATRAESAAACHAEVQRRWTPAVQAKAFVAALHRVLQQTGSTDQRVFDT